MRFKKKKIVISALVILCALVFLFMHSGKTLETGTKNSQRQLKYYLESHHINGVMLVNGKNGSPIVVKNNETSDKQKIVKANKLFAIASLQKIMTGTAIYQLKQKNQLNWATPLSKYYPQVPGSKEITIQELLNHTSGLINNNRPSSPLKNQKEQIAYMLKYIKYDHLHTWDYQDVDYELLAAIISKQTSLTYNAYIQKEFAKPLKLKQIKDFSEVKKEEVPQPLGNNVDWHKVTVTTSSDFGAGNLFMTPNEYWKFVYNKVLKDPNMIKAFSRQAQSQAVSYFGGVYFKGNVIYAEGSIPGYNCCFVANYKTKQMIMLFSNNIKYLDLKEASDFLRRNYMGEFVL